MKTIETLDPKAFRGLITTIGELPSSFVDSMSYYEMIAWLVDYIKNNVIPAVNNNAEAIKEIQKWIETLDLQDEVDNKLDEMAASGQLAEIISQYLNSTAIFGYDSVAAMKSAENLVAGSFARTLGYYSANDGGGALYKIRAITNDDVVDEAFIVAINENLIAEMVVENDTINIVQLGATSDGNIATQINKYLAKGNKHYRLFIPTGTWLCGELPINSFFDIYGNSKFDGATVIKPYTANQAYIFKIGNGADVQRWSVEGLHFETGSEKPLTDSVIILNNVSYGSMKDLTFQNVIGQAIKNIGSFEINFYNLIARHVMPAVLGSDKGVFSFESTSGRIPSTLYFDYVQLEAIFGNIFYVKTNSALYNNRIDCINFEETGVATGQTQTDSMVSGLTMTSVNDIADKTMAAIGSYTHFGIFNQGGNSDMCGLSIGSIDLNNTASCVFHYNSVDYIFDCVFQKLSASESAKANIAATVDSITLVGTQKDNYLLNVRNKSTCAVDKTKNQLKIGKIVYTNTSSYKFVMAVRSECGIVLGDILSPSENFITRNVFGCYELCNRTETGDLGMIDYEEKALAKGNMAVYPRTTRGEGGYIETIATGGTLRLRIRATATSSLEVLDVDKNTSTTLTINNTNGEYLWFGVNLLGITNFQYGDKIRIGGSSGWNFRYDLGYFVG